MREVGDEANICAHNPYEIKIERLDKPQFLIDAIRRVKSFVNNFDALREQFRVKTGEIEKRLQGGQNVLIITNHMTLANIPLNISLLISSSQDPEFLMDSLWTIMGPSLMTNQQEKHTILSLTNVLLTQPSTANGKVPGFDQKQKRRAFDFYRECQKLCAASESTGKLLILAASGTRDKIIRGDGIERSLVMMKEASRGANRLVASLKNTVMFPIMVDDDGLYTGRKARVIDVGISFSDFVENDQTSLGEQMQVLAKMVGDVDGKKSLICMMIRYFFL